MTEMGEIVKKLKETAKGKLIYNREKKFEDIYIELQQLICLSVQPPKHSERDEKKEVLVNVNSSLQEEKKAKVNNANKINQVPDHTFANYYAEVEQEIIQYEVERKESVKKLVGNKKRSWEKDEQKLHKESEEKIELFRKAKLDKKIENCIQVAEKITENSPDVSEQETDPKIKETIQKESPVTEETEKRSLLHRRDLETVLNELNSNLDMILHKIQCYPQYGIQENDISIQCLKNANENLQHMIYNNQKISASDVKTAMSHVLMSKQVIQVLNDVSGKMESAVSSRDDSKGDFAIVTSSSKQDELEEFINVNDSLNTIPSSEERMDGLPCFNFNVNNYSHTVPVHTTALEITSLKQPIATAAITEHVSLNIINKPSVQQDNSSIQNKFPLPHLTLQSQSELEIQSIDEEKIEVEEMDSLSVQEDNYDENVINEYVPREALKKYLSLEMFLQKWKEGFESETSSPEWKKKRLDLQKAINTPLNSMSVLSGAHLFDKIQRLSGFLSGKNVEIAGKIVSINVAPQAKYFCMDLLAKKLVSQGENQVSSCHQDAFPLAAATVHLWQQHSDLGMLFMAHIHRKCPYIVPYYIPRQENQTEEQHYKALGYIYTDGAIEKQHQFLKRMSGIVRLYAAVIQTQPIIKKPHPHGIRYGWTWMAHVMNLEPRPDITATILFDFLQVCGHALEKAYGKQFQKLLLTLATEFLLKIKKITGGSSGPLLRLENFLKESLEQGFISPPAGIITHDFWKTS